MEWWDIVPSESVWLAGWLDFSSLMSGRGEVCFEYKRRCLFFPLLLSSSSDTREVKDESRSADMLLI